MNGDQQADLVFYTLALVLPLSALLARRIPLSQSLKMAGAWIGIFLIGLVIVGLSRGVHGNLRERITSVLGDDEQRVSGNTVRLRMAPDGHFWAAVTVNGVPRRMLVDSGATTTSLSIGTAKAAKLNLDESPFPVPIMTGNGMVMARTSTAAEFKLGPIEARDLRVVVADAFGDTDVLGMNFLSRLHAWRVEDRTLVMEPNKP